jgi:hypothetical protein
LRLGLVTVASGVGVLVLTVEDVTTLGVADADALALGLSLTCTPTCRTVTGAGVEPDASEIPPAMPRPTSTTALPVIEAIFRSTFIVPLLVGCM